MGTDGKGEGGHWITIRAGKSNRFVVSFMFKKDTYGEDAAVH